MKIVLNIKDKYVSSFKYIIVGFALIIGVSYVYFFQGGNNNLYLLLATIFAIYMALNLGANDIANNMGPAVGSKALTIGGALLIAAIFEAAGALIAGGDVVDTIKSGIINKDMITDSKDFINIMLATILGAALWINVATFFKAPISTTNSIIGGLIGAGLASAGPSIVKWSKIGEIASSWIISLIMGGIIAILIFISIRKTILKRDERGEAAKNWVPIYVGIMMMIFSIYLLLKGLKPILNSNEFLHNIINPTNAVFIGFIIGVASYMILVVLYKKHKKSFFKDDKKFINTLFNIPLIFAVALLSFAHGSNDVANAIGPLAAINETIKNGGAEIAKAAGVPFWIMLLGALGLSMGLAVFGARLIKTVGNEITKLDQIRAFCVALSAAITVLLASALGLPVSSTQIALGAIFGIGLFRQYLSNKKGEDKEVIDKSMMKGILLSWIVTLPIAGVISAITYIVLKQF
ncbi:MAG: inorganic phosphate transporter [Candidatus Gracilibacteria bacterium]|nr:inorganic phosphate transporter [Candidatus Gracilibacteria bacterium]